MKSIKTIRSLVLLAMLAAGGAACSKEEVTATGGDAPQGIPLNITVADDGYTAATPRASENSYATTFTAGDQIGLYSVKPDGTYAAENACLTLADGGDGTLTWQAPAGTNLWYEGATAKYFAYYPYQATPNGTPRPAATAAPDFFADVVARWTPATDQSTPARYTAQDLMTGRGQPGSKLPDGTFALAFTMTHAMALVVIETPTTKYTFDNTPAIPEYNIPAPDTRFVGFTPYSPSVGTYRYLVKPATNDADLYGSYTAANGNTKEYAVSSNIAAATYCHKKVDGGCTTVIAKEHTLAVGDFYFSDGTLKGKDASLTAAQQAACIGVVYWVGDITTGDPLLKTDHPACTHALVVAVQDAAAATMQWCASFELLNSWTNAADRGDDKVNITVLDKMQGYANTKALTAYNTLHSGSIVLPIAAIEQYATAHPAPKNSSGWYVPSVNELKYMCWGQHNSQSTLGKKMLNTQFEKVGGASFLQSGSYWSSTENDGSWAWFVYFNYGHVGGDGSKRSYSYGARAVLAF
ncbi:MAG: fimbrillin family protein [Odoribacter sp.]